MAKYLIILSTLALISCGNIYDDPPTQENEDAFPAEVNLENVDIAKLEQIEHDFHLLFLDLELNPIDLNNDEVLYYFQQKDDQQPTELIDDTKPKKTTEGDCKGLSYVDCCKKQSVPIPPPWGDAKWKKKGTLPKNRVFNAPRFQPVEVWEYSTPTGVCIALPRYKPGGKSIAQIGFICQNNDNGKACFWAAQNRKTGEAFPPDKLKGLKPEDMRDGNNLSLNCTQCHRGNNVFITHPDTVLDKVVEEPDKRYTPVSDQAGWTNPKSKLKLKDCSSCHDFATVTAVWCKTVLKKALGTTMPPGVNFKTTPKKKWIKAYEKDLTKFSKACKELGVDLGLGL